jgi:hypothetical protein
MDTAVSDSANVGVELVAGRCRARSRAREYDNRWVICTGPRTCKRAGHNEKRYKGVMGTPGFYVVVYSRGGHKDGILEDALMSEKEARERAGCLPTRSKPVFGGWRCPYPVLYPSNWCQSPRGSAWDPTRLQKGDPECLR